MGWTFVKDKPRTLTPAAYIESQETAPEFSEVMARATVNSTVFLAVKVKKPTKLLGEIFEAAPDGSVTYALVCMFEIRGAEFGWKTMDETVGPFGEKAPAAFLEKLSKVKPKAPSYAEKWRARQKEAA
jgi:hypothetical protein